MVAVRSRVFASDEELGKRDDDRKPRNMPNWNIKKAKPTWRKRRLVLAVLACFGVYLFIHYMPTDLGPVDRTTGRRMRPPPSRAGPPPDQGSDAKKAWEDIRKPPTTPPAAQDEPDAPIPHDYDGPIRFYYLAATLRAGEKARSANSDIGHVLFAASNLKSAGAIIPMACEMARWKKNIVHMAVMGRDDIPIDQIQSINSAPTDACPIWWHDARPDLVLSSTDHRMEVSISGALGHINSFVHPVAVITTDLDSEDTFFAHGIESKAKQVGITHIQVPKEDPESLTWATRLEAKALQAWHTASIDVLVQAPLESSGSLVRLLKSLAAADYSGFSPPRLTIELPHSMDTSTMNFLSRFRWPPASYARPGENDQLTIRRRIFEQKNTVEEASLRFIESFYPTSPQGPHVFLLSPRTELSPVYFHYLKLLVLQYRHSKSLTNTERNMLGFSLESPSVHLDGISAFQPSSLPSNPEKTANEDSVAVPFRWQAPNSNAALYFADKWMEVHSFLMKRHSATRRPALQAHYKSEKKVVSEKSPAWAEHFLQLMMNRGYFLHYPGLRLPSALAIVHNELYQVPEEFAHADAEESPTTVPDPPPPTESILTAVDDYLKSHHPHPPSILNIESPLAQDLEDILAPISPPPSDRKESDSLNTPGLPPNPAMPILSTLPLLDHRGDAITFDKLIDYAEAARIAFRASAGGCSEDQSKQRQMVPMTAEDLFCFDGREPELAPDAEVFSKVIQDPPLGGIGTVADNEDDDDDDEDDEEKLLPSANDQALDQALSEDQLVAAGLATPAHHTPEDGTIREADDQPAVDNNIVPVPEGAPAADAARFQEVARENMKKLEAATRIPGDPEPAPVLPEINLGPVPKVGDMKDAAEPGTEGAPGPKPGPANAPANLGQISKSGDVENADRRFEAPAPPNGNELLTDTGPKPQPEKDKAADDGAPQFPVLDSSKIKAFDEGREAERDVEVDPQNEPAAPEEVPGPGLR